MRSKLWREHGQTLMETEGLMYGGHSEQRPQSFTSSRGCKGTLCFAIVLSIVISVYMLTLHFGEVPHVTPNRVPNERKEEAPILKLGNQMHLGMTDDDSTITSNGICKNRLLRKLDDILLVINFNYAFYSIIPILLEYYSPIFPKYAICGPQRSGKYKILIVKHLKSEPGYYSYNCLVQAMKKNPGYRGYLFLNDDMIVNWWTLLNLDKSKLWVGCIPDFDRANPINKPAPNRWWKRAGTAERCSAAFHDVEKKPWSENMRATYYANTNNKQLCLSCWSDIYYIPSRHKANFLWLMDIFSKRKVFLEAAVPTTMAMLEIRRNYLQIMGVYLPDVFGVAMDYLEGGLAWEMYNTQLTFIHPYKFSGYNRTENTARFREIVMDVSKEVLDKRCLDIVMTKSKKKAGQFHWKLKLDDS